MSNNSTFIKCINHLQEEGQGRGGHRAPCKNHHIRGHQKEKGKARLAADQRHGDGDGDGGGGHHRDLPPEMGDRAALL